MQKFKKLVALLLLCTFFAFSSMPLTPFAQGDNQAAYAGVQQENTIILEMGSYDSDDIKDMRDGEGKLFDKIAKAIEQLKTSGDVGENAQPIIVLVKKTSSKDDFGFSPLLRFPK